MQIALLNILQQDKLLQMELFCYKSHK